MDGEMSTDKIPAKPPDHNQTSLAGRKPPATNLAQSDQALKCPRCDSPNTKFCYYNNYSLTQPRHFCKTCRRYWTKGGALRNVPIGGGCRKSKKTKSAATTPSSEAARLKFLSGLSSAMEFQLSGLPFTRLHSANSVAFSQLFSLGGLSSSAAISPCSAIDAVPCTSSLHGFSCTSATDLTLGESGVFRGGVHENIAASIESLSSINQDLHWKLQQQRLAMLSGSSAPLVENQQQQQQQPILFPPAGSSKMEACVDGNTNVLFMENSCTVADGNSDMNMSTWNEIQTWNDLHQYSEFP